MITLFLPFTSLFGNVKFKCNHDLDHGGQLRNYVVYCTKKCIVLRGQKAEGILRTRVTLAMLTFLQPYSCFKHCMHSTLSRVELMHHGHDSWQCQHPKQGMSNIDSARKEYPSSACVGHFISICSSLKVQCYCERVPNSLLSLPKINLTCLQEAEATPVIAPGLLLTHNAHMPWSCRKCM